MNINIFNSVLVNHNQGNLAVDLHIKYTDDDDGGDDDSCKPSKILHVQKLN